MTRRWTGWALVLLAALLLGVGALKHGWSPDGILKAAKPSHPAPAPANPQLDTSFGNQGLATATVGASYADAQAMALDAKGRIVTAGLLSRFFGVFRFTPNGSPDLSFGDAGHVSTPTGQFARAKAVAVQPDGRILVAGFAGVDPGTSRASVALFRYLPDGALDGSFGHHGVVTASFKGDATANAIALQPDGRILLGGSADLGDITPRPDFLLLRYLPNGKPDATFGASGVVTTKVSGSSDIANAVAYMNDDRIVVAGTADNGDDLHGSNIDVAIARYLPNGDLDAAFAGRGAVTKDLGSKFDSANAVHVAADGTIVFAGGPEMVIGRYRPDGILDTTFGTGGVTRTNAAERAGQPGADGGTAFGLAIDDDGRLIVAGRAPRNRAAVLRYTPAGGLDPTFGPNGVAITPFGGDLSSAFATTLDDAGRILVAGCTCVGGNSFARGGTEIPSSVIVARYRPRS